MPDTVYYLDEYDWKMNRWKLMSSDTKKVDAIQTVKKTSVKGHKMRIRKVTTEIIFEYEKK